MFSLKFKCLKVDNKCEFAEFIEFCIGHQIDNLDLIKTGCLTLVNRVCTCAAIFTNHFSL